MIVREKDIDIMICIGLAKLFTEQSTYLIGELKGEKKQWFNTATKATDNFIAIIEKDFGTEQHGVIEELMNAFHDGVQNLKKELKQ